MDDKITEKPINKICFFCGQEYPQETELDNIYSYWLCDTCKNEMSKGIPLIAISKKPSFENQQPMFKYASFNRKGNPVNKPMYPTGEWSVYSEDAIIQFFGEEQGRSICEAKQGLISDEVFDEIKRIYKNVKIHKDDSDESEEGDAE